MWPAFITACEDCLGDPSYSSIKSKIKGLFFFGCHVRDWRWLSLANLNLIKCYVLYQHTWAYWRRWHRHLKCWKGKVCSRLMSRTRSIFLCWHYRTVEKVQAQNMSCLTVHWHASRQKVKMTAVVSGIKIFDCWRSIEKGWPAQDNSIWISRHETFKWPHKDGGQQWKDQSYWRFVGNFEGTVSGFWTRDLSTNKCAWSKKLDRRKGIWIHNDFRISKSFHDYTERCWLRKDEGSRWMENAAELC